jgi:hypothetical protein
MVLAEASFPGAMRKPWLYGKSKIRGSHGVGDAFRKSRHAGVALTKMTLSHDIRRCSTPGHRRSWTGISRIRDIVEAMPAMSPEWHAQGCVACSANTCGRRRLPAAGGFGMISHGPRQPSAACRLQEENTASRSPLSIIRTSRDPYLTRRSEGLSLAADVSISEKT